VKRVRVHRYSPWVLVAGWIFAGFGAASIVPALNSLSAAAGLSKAAVEGQTYAAPAAEYLNWILAPLGLLIGIALIATWLYSTLTLSESGLEYRDMFGRVAVQARWEELSEYQLTGDSGECAYVYAGERKVFVYNLKILEEVQRHAPHIVRRA
jgi:hypothetical protein